MLFRVWEIVDLLSNRVLELFLSSFDGEVTKNASSLKSTNGGERDEHLLLFCRTEPLGRKRETLGRTGIGINTP
jgi:hypothetical protein